MEDVSSDGRQAVLQCTDEFIAALKSNPTVKRFHEAARRFETDEEVLSLRKRLRQFEEARRKKGVPPNQFRDLRDTQAQLRNHPVVQEFFASRDQVSELLQRTNVAISEILGIDVGQTAGPAASCCC